MDIEEYNRVRGYLTLGDTQLLIKTIERLPEGKAKAALAELVAEIGYDENPIMEDQEMPICRCGMVAYNTNGWSMTNNGRWICQACSEG